MSKKVIAAGPFVGEFGWELMGFSGVVRNLSLQEVYKNHDILVMTSAGRYPIYHEYAKNVVPLPSWYTNLRLESASYGAVGLSAELYGELIRYFRRFYYDKYDEVYELRPPTDHNFDFMMTRQQAWKRLLPSEVGLAIRDNIVGEDFKKDTLVLMPRFRRGVTQFVDNEDFSLARNWPPEYWSYVIEKLSKDFLVVVAGTRNGIPPINYNIPNVINLADHLDPMYIMDATIAFFNISIGNICSQSGGTHLGLQSCCPSWVLGHEMHRHAVQCNPLNTSCMYLETGLPYSNVGPEEAYKSMMNFIDLCLQNIHKDRMNILREDEEKRRSNNV